MAKNKTGAGSYAVHLFLPTILIYTILSQTIPQTEKCSCQMFNVILICSVISITLQINKTLNMPTFYHSDKTKAQLLGLPIKQRNILQKVVTASLYRKRQSDIATYYLMETDLAYCNNIYKLVKN
jgi:hypothetical protein